MSSQLCEKSFELDVRVFRERREQHAEALATVNIDCLRTDDDARLSLGFECQLELFSWFQGIALPIDEASALAQVTKIDLSLFRFYPPADRTWHADVTSPFSLHAHGCNSPLDTRRGTA